MNIKLSLSGCEIELTMELVTFDMWGNKVTFTHDEFEAVTEAVFALKHTAEEIGWNLEVS